MQQGSLLQDLVVVYGLGALVVYLFQKLRQSNLVGFLVTGILVGPSGLSLVSNAEHVHDLAEIGVMLLLFSLGLEFSVKKLMKLRYVVFGTGPLQVAMTVLAVVGIAAGLGIDGRAGTFLGFLMALSSTAIVLRLLTDQGEMDSIHGKTSLGILIFQDLCVVPMIVLVPLLAEHGPILVPLGRALGKSAVVIVAVIVLARIAFPALLNHIAETRSKELFVIASLWILLGMAWSLSMFGFSLALGAFLAGLTLSESEYSHQIFAEMRPFRDGLNSLFFISIGMLVNLGFLGSHIGPILGLVAAVVFGKSIILLLAVVLWRLPMQVALMVGLPMAQIGEFSFVLLEAGRDSGLVSQSWYQHLISSAVATMALTPLFFWASRTLLANSRVASLLRRLGTRPSIRELDSAAGMMHDHVLICGFGVTGQNIAAVLKANRIAYVILELNSSTVRRERQKGEPIFFGDCTDQGILRHAGIMNARTIVLAISDPLATRMAVRVSRLLNPELVILTRSKYLSEIDGLLDLGANEVISEEFESSFELLARILRVYHFPRQLVAQEIKSIRDARYGIFRHAQTTVPRLRLSTRLDVYIETFKLEPGSPACGRRISETGLRRESGALVLGVIREPETLNNPDPSVVLEQGDFLVMSGTKDQLRRAMQMLSGRN